jgi:hypothetical protein
MLWQRRTESLVALGAGLVVGTYCYHAGPFVSSALNGLAAFAGSLVTGVGRWLSRTLGAGAEAA